MTKPPELKPCPFCSGAKVYVRTIMQEADIFCPECETNGPVHDSEAEAIAAWNTRASDPADLAPHMTKPRVKPLVWDGWDGGMTVAATPWGKYNLNSDLRLSFPTGAYRRYETEVCAKAAAQADYEARILSALDLTPDPAVQALVEAAKRISFNYHHGKGSEEFWAAYDALDAALAAFDKT